MRTLSTGMAGATGRVAKRPTPPDRSSSMRDTSGSRGLATGGGWMKHGGAARKGADGSERSGRKSGQVQTEAQARANVRRFAQVAVSPLLVFPVSRLIFPPRRITSTMKTGVWVLVLLLVLLHQDEFFWGSTHLVGGFLPVGMAWHIGISLASAVVWYLATRYAWPVDDPSEPASPGRSVSP
jgi:hypothetical protein